jgi:two-component system cell cycle sensor histidine kinase/response regulator CckA
MLTLTTPTKNVILVVDDESIIIRMATVALATVGFRAAVAEDGFTGLATYEAMQKEICLVLADVKMPKSTGVEMADRIRELNPQAKILLMSGYSDDDLVVQAKGRYPFINKPFLPADLIRKIRATLGDDDPSVN